MERASASKCYGVDEARPRASWRLVCLSAIWCSSEDMVLTFPWHYPKSDTYILLLYLLLPKR